MLYFFKLNFVQNASLEGIYFNNIIFNYTNDPCFH